ncbi:MAG: nitrilase-related carbon-nitrogen hydrolase [Myxococcota bacterium]
MTQTHAIDSYRAIALQLRCHAVHRLRQPADARARMAQCITRLSGHIRAALAFFGRDIKLVVLPEYFMTGFPMGEPVDAWIAKACLRTGCAEYEQLGAIAQATGIYLAGNAYETDEHFAGKYFQTCFVIAPSGDLILRYRRLNSMYATTPHDVWDAYLDRYGLDGVFPVARTEIGNLAALASEEILYPELARCAVMRGAEILLHSTSEIHHRAATPKDIAKRARAIENMAYVVSANSAGIIDTAVPEASTDGGSAIIDHRGLVIAEAAPGESMSACGDIELAGLRRIRRRPGMGNLLSRQRFELYNACYGPATAYPPNTLADRAPTRDHFVATQERAIQHLIDTGVLS